MKLKYEDIYAIMFIIAGSVSIIYIICKIIEWTS